MQDFELLAEYVRTASQDAFTKVVSIHIDAVYASARRQVRDPQLAEDVTQAVFIVLASKAKTLDPRFPLLGWLMKTTWFASRDALKKQARRRRYEQEAAAMRSRTDATDVAKASQQIEADLDDALARLGDTDRTAVALRFLESNSVAEVGVMMGISTEAAAKRIGRALAKLRKILSRRDAFPAAIPIATLLEAIPKSNAPARLVQSAASIGTAGGAITEISQGAIKMMIWSKAKAAAILIGLMLATAGTGIGTWSIVHAQTEQPVAAPALDPLNYRAVLKSGISIELLGISEHPSKGKPWWRADGSILPAAPYEKAQGSIVSGDANVVPREIGVRINRDVPGQAEPATVEWNIRDSKGTSGGAAPLDKAGREVVGVESYALILPDTFEGVTLEARIGTGPWVSGGSIPANSGGTIPLGIFSYSVKPPREIDGKTHYDFTRNGIELAGVTHRIIAIDTQGHETIGWIIRMTGSLMSADGELVIPLPLNQIKELQYRQRVMNQWVEIRNISIHAGQLTEVKVSTSDDPPPTK